MIKTDSNFKTPTKDQWDFGYCWVPFGKAGEVYYEDGSVDYNVEIESVINTQSINTLVGTPIYIQHPNYKPVYGRDNVKEEIVGTCLDKWRESTDGLGGEVLVKIYKEEVLNALRTGELCEVSPCYSSSSGYRDYNHLALLGKNQARGGSKMSVKLESLVLDSSYVLEKNITDLEKYFKVSDRNVYEIKLAEKKEAEEEAEEAEEEALTTENTRIESKIMEELLQKISGGQDTMIELLRQTLAVEVAEETEPDEKLESIKLESYNTGLADGKVLTFATSVGYKGDSVPEAKSFVINLMSPDIKIEGRSPAEIEGMYSVAQVMVKPVKVESKVPASFTAEKLQEPSEIKSRFNLTK